MSFPAQSLEATGGTIYSHIFENTTIGLQRDHFWSLAVDFAPINYDGESWKCSASVEWLRFPVRDWRTLSNRHVQDTLKDELVEASFYVASHDWATVQELTLERIDCNRFRIAIALAVEFQGFSGGDANPKMEISAETDIEYTGLIIVPENLSPTPNTLQMATEVVEVFVDPAAYHSAEDEGFRFLLKPKS